jgi:type II secretory pathway pseudopilin PulG
MQRVSQKEKSTQKGSFLLEMLVAFGIIAMSLTVVVDSFVTSQKSYRGTAEEGQLVQALTMLLEDMTREARVSESYQCGTGPSPCPVDTVLIMTHIENLNNQGVGEEITFRKNGATIEKDINSGGYVDMTPPDIVVDSFSVQVYGDPAVKDQIQALVTVSAYHKNNIHKKVQLQTSFTERMY